jgi:hypothetical protein
MYSSRDIGKIIFFVLSNPALTSIAITALVAKWLERRRLMSPYVQIYFHDGLVPYNFQYKTISHLFLQAFVWVLGDNEFGFIGR